MPYPIITSPFYSTSATIPAPLPSHSFSHDYTTSFPNPSPSSMSYSNPSPNFSFGPVYTPPSRHFPHAEYHDTTSPLGQQRSTPPLYSPTLPSSNPYTPFASFPNQSDYSGNSPSPMASQPMAAALFSDLRELCQDIMATIAALRDEMREEEPNSKPENSVLTPPDESLISPAQIEAFSVIDADPVSDAVAEPKLPVTEVFKTLDSPTPVPDSSVPAINEREEPLPDPPSIFQMLPQVASFPRTWPSPPPQVDAVSTVTISGSKHGFDFIFRTPDRLRPTRFELEKFFATTGSPAKTKGNTNFVFDPGGTFRDDHHSSGRRRCHKKFQKLYSLLTPSSFISFPASASPSAFPATASSFPAMQRPPPGPASGLPWVPWQLSNTEDLRVRNLQQPASQEQNCVSALCSFLGQPVFVTMDQSYLLFVVLGFQKKKRQNKTKEKKQEGPLLSGLLLAYPLPIVQAFDLEDKINLKGLVMIGMGLFTAEQAQRRGRPISHMMTHNTMGTQRILEGW